MTRHYRHVLLLLVALCPQTLGFIQTSSMSSRRTVRTSLSSLSPSHGRRGAPTMLADVSSLWQDYLHALDVSPLLTKSLTAAVLLPGGDLSAQLIEKFRPKEATTPATLSDDNNGIDWGRVFRFGLFGLILQAPWNHFYYQALDSVLPPPQDPFSFINVEKTFIDQFIQAPIFTAIIFLFLGTLEGKSVDQLKAKLQADYFPTMTANWKLWIPVTAINICFCPPELRVLFVNVVFFGWSIFLSLVVNAREPEAST